MAIPDLLWACPECGMDRGLRPAGRHVFACAGCDVRFRRDRAADIHATWPDGRTEVRTAAAWADQLPSIEELVESAGEGEGPIRSARVQARRVAETDVVRGHGGYLNRVEIFGDAADGTLELHPERLLYRPEGKGKGATEWPLERLTAVQASSRTLQLKVRHEPLVSFRFLDDSIFLWELLLQAVVRRFYARSGRGEVVEFQPRIVTDRRGRSESSAGEA